MFCRDAIFVANLGTFLATFYRTKKYGGVPKMTSMRYGLDLAFRELSFLGTSLSNVPFWLKLSFVKRPTRYLIGEK